MRRGSLVLLLYWLCGLCGWSSLAAQDTQQAKMELKRRQVPKEVRRNVRLAYPYHLYRDWAREDTLYSVRVISKDYETVYFDSTGEWLRAYRPVRPSELPYRTYLFLKEEFGVYRVLRAYQVQQSDDLAYYSVEMEHKRIHSLKTYLEFDFFGDMTMLDGEPVGATEAAVEADQLSQADWAALYAEVYDPVAEEAAYAAEAKALADAAVQTVDTVFVAVPDASVVEADTSVRPIDTLVAMVDTVMAVVDTTVTVDTVVPEPVAGTMSGHTIDTVAVQPVDTTIVADTTVLVSGTMSGHTIDTMSVQPLDTLVAAPADTPVRPADTAILEPVADTAVVEPLPDTTSVQPLDTVSVAPADTVSVQPADTLVAVPADTSVRPVDTVVPEVPLYPEIVGKNFKKRFPNAEKVGWRKSDGLYLVTFDQFGQVMAAAFREDGVQLYTAYAFSRKEMPLPIERYLQASAAKMKMTEGWRVVHESKYKRMFASSERPKDYYYVIMGQKIPKSKQWRYIRYVFNQNAQFESKSNYEQPSDK